MRATTTTTTDTRHVSHPGDNGGHPACGDGAPLRVDKISVPGGFPNLDVDLEMIEAHVDSEGGERVVVAFHRHRFEATFAHYTEQCRRPLDLLEAYIRDLEARIAGAAQQLRDTDPFIRREDRGGERSPWNPLDRATAVTLVLFSVALLAIGINTLATYLIGSGYIVFAETPALAYLLSAVNLGVTGLLKVGSAWCQDDRARHRYFRSLWGAGLVSGTCWVGSFAALFPQIQAEGLDEIVSALSSNSGSSVDVLEAIFVASQLIAEICIAAALWITLEKLVRGHAPLFIVEDNPEYRAWARTLAVWKEQLREAAEKFAALNGVIKEIEAREEAYVLAASAALTGMKRDQRNRTLGLKG